MTSESYGRQPRLFKKNFTSDFAGIDGESSSLEEDGNGANVAQNLEFSLGNSIKGRLGCQTAAPGCQMAAIFPYSYSRTQDEYLIKYQLVGGGAYPGQTGSLSTTRTKADGQTINKLIGINNQIWVLDQMVIPITVTAGTYPFTWYSTVSGSNIYFRVLANGVQFLDIACGTGTPSATTIYSLLGTADAHANLSISRTTRGTCPPVAIVNGNQVTALIVAAGYGNVYQIAVDLGHTFYPGDVITLGGVEGGLEGGIVTAVAAGTINYIGRQWTLSDNAVLGYMAQSAASFPISTIATASAGALNWSFPYWRLIPEGDRVGADYGGIYAGLRAFSQTRTASSFFAPPVAVSVTGNLYVASSADPLYDADTYWNNLIKIDGLTAVRAGLPAPTIAVTAPAAAGALLGAYKYKAFLKRIDAQGNVVEGPVSTIQSITYAAPNQYGQIVISGNLYSNIDGFQGRSAYKYTVEAPASGQFFYIDDNSAAPGLNAFIQPGDPICLLDNTAAKTGLWHQAFGVDVLGALHRGVCTDYDGNTVPSSIKMSESSGYTIPNNTEISTGLTAVVLRTAVGGNTYYILAEVPYTGYATFTFFDNVTDAVLTAGEQYLEVPIGKEHDAPPPCSLVCEHQGGLVVARGITAPNTVAVSSADGVEYFPTASNSFDIPSTLGGYVTAIASDTTDRLAVFKELGYYDIIGDIDAGDFSVTIKNEGDYGITSQSSLRRVKGVLIGLSKLGFITISNGNLISSPFSGLNARIVDQPSLTLNWAVAINDSTTRQYICSIPTSLTTAPITYVIDYSRGGKIPAPFTRVYGEGVDPGNGMAIVNNVFYHLSITSYNSVFKKLPRFLNNSPTGNDGDSFIDNTFAISYILESNSIHYGEPGQLKTPLRVRLWSIPNDYVVEGWVPFATLVETGASPIASYIGGSNPLATTSTVTFATTNDLFKDVKLNNCKTHFYLIRFTTNTIRTAPFLTGYEILFAGSYDREDFVK